MGEENCVTTQLSASFYEPHSSHRGKKLEVLPKVPPEVSTVATCSRDKTLNIHISLQPNLHLFSRSAVFQDCAFPRLQDSGDSLGTVPYQPSSTPQIHKH